jgi:hypothetical protein
MRVISGADDFASDHDHSDVSASDEMTERYGRQIRRRY